MVGEPIIMNEGILDYILNSDNIYNEEFKTCLESIESDLKELDSIDKSIESYEKASFESTMENVNLLNSVLVYKNIKSGIALESVSVEFGIANEGAKEIAEKGVDAIKALGNKLLKILKAILSFFKIESRTVKNIRKKIKLTEEELRYIHKTNNDKDIFKKLYDPDRFSYIFTKELILCKFLNKNMNYKDWANRLKGTYITQEYIKTLEDTLLEVYVDGSNDIIEFITWLENGKDFNPAGKINDLKHFFENYDKIVYKKSNNAFDYDSFDFLNNIYVLTDLLEKANKNISGKIESLIRTAKVSSIITSSRNKYGIETLNELIALLTRYKTEHSKNIKEYVSYCGEYLKEVKKYEHLDKEKGEDNMKKSKDNSKLPKFHQDASNPN